LDVPDVKDLRPTPDRVRETLFNWLAPIIAEAHCLDLFAGTGALGFEAMSRGAASVTMVDQSLEVVKALEAGAAILKAPAISIYAGSVPAQLRQPKQPFDIVFLDPPYKSNLLLPTSLYLEENDFLSSSAYIYLEASEIIKDNDLPPNWRIIKSKQAGQVAYHLAMRELEK
jgi:16S rRNA (guanine966-N2)-methyltransferase